MARRGTVRVYGIDFTSNPQANKPLTQAVCRLRDGSLTVESLHTMCSYQAFALFLAQPGEWIAGVDFPFGQPRRLVTDMGWPNTWAGYVRKVAEYSKSQYAKEIDGYRKKQSKGQKEHFRVVDRLAGSLSPMKIYGVPVGKMFHQGTPFLLASRCRIVPFTTELREAVVVEAYPGLVSRKFIARRSYKNDDPGKQTADQKDARRVLMGSLVATSAEPAKKSTSDWYGFHVRLPTGLDTACVDDPSGDKLDAVLAAVQAAWAHTRRDQNYGVPATCDQLEGWIPDPEMLPAGQPPGAIP
jgi:hypothetical protein